jgi:hypothetical protein
MIEALFVALPTLNLSEVPKHRGLLSPLKQAIFSAAAFFSFLRTVEKADPPIGHSRTRRPVFCRSHKLGAPCAGDPTLFAFFRQAACLSVCRVTDSRPRKICISEHSPASLPTPIPRRQIRLLSEIVPRQFDHLCRSAEFTDRCMLGSILWRLSSSGCDYGSRQVP